MRSRAHVYDLAAQYATGAGAVLWVAVDGTNVLQAPAALLHECNLYKL